MMRQSGTPFSWSIDHDQQESYQPDFADLDSIGERAECHGHTAAALRFVVEADGSAHQCQKANRC
jgi:hypothetical protein